VGNANRVFNVAPDRRGLVPDDQVQVLRALRERWQTMDL